MEEVARSSGNSSGYNGAVPTAVMGGWDEPQRSQQ